jgi:5'-3' exoribonuclease 2
VWYNVKLVDDFLFLFLQGCASWKWYFPYHYAPFASDFINIAELSTDFEKGTQPVRM